MNKQFNHINSSLVEAKFIEGHRLAISKLIEQKTRENGYLVISVNGKPTKVAAKDIKL